MFKNPRSFRKRSTVGLFFYHTEIGSIVFFLLFKRFIVYLSGFDICFRVLSLIF